MRSSAAQAEDGFSLVEVLISVVIIGICFAGLLAGLGSSILASTVHRDQADGHALLVSVAEAVKDQSRNPYGCPAVFDLTSGVQVPSGWTLSNDPSTSNVDVTAVEYGSWDGAGIAVAAACSASTDLQRVTLVATSPDGRAVDEITFLKRRP